MNAERRDDDADTPLAVARPEPGEETFWQAHSPRFELPISFTSSALVMAGLFALLLGIYFVANRGATQAPVPIALADDGFDPDGAGAAGAGGEPDPIAIGFAPPSAADAQHLPHPEDLPNIKKILEDQLKIEDPDALVPISDQKAREYSTFAEEARKKVLGIGAQRGKPGGVGAGDDPAGADKGGKGADSTRARTMRWVMRFSTRSGRDYLDQLAALKAVVVVPLPPDGKTAYVFRDLINPKAGNYVEEKEWAKLAGQIQFCDYKKTSVTEVSGALNLNFTPTSFWAFFPKDLEAELTRLEIAYANKQPEQIEETVFEVTVRAGTSRIVVASQKMKR